MYACHDKTFVATNTCLSWQTHVCHDKTCLLLQQMYACHDKTCLLLQMYACHDKTCLLFQQMYACHDKTFVATNMCLSWQTHVCHDKTCLLLQQMYACHDKTCLLLQMYACHDKTCLLLQQTFACHDKTFVATNIFLEWQIFVVTNIILSWLNCCHDTLTLVTTNTRLSPTKYTFCCNKSMLDTTKLLSQQKGYLWQLPPMTPDLLRDTVRNWPSLTWPGLGAVWCCTAWACASGRRGSGWCGPRTARWPPSDTLCWWAGQEAGAGTGPVRTPSPGDSCLVNLVK